MAKRDQHRGHVVPVAIHQVHQPRLFLHPVEEYPRLAERRFNRQGVEYEVRIGRGWRLFQIDIRDHKTPEFSIDMVYLECSEWVSGT